MHRVAQAWCSEIDKNVSACQVVGKKESLKFLKLSRAWRRILRNLDSASIRSVLEVGSGTGPQLLPLARRGYSTVGIDCSRKALRLCREMVHSIRNATGIPLAVSLVCGDFFDLELNARFSLVFHRGVSEHYLDREDRRRFIQKMFEYAADDGYIVSIVPSGIHPLRTRFRDEALGGYNIPEIDYSPEILIEEALSCGGKDVIVLPHNIMGYLSCIPAGRLIRAASKLIYLFFQLIPQIILPASFKNRHAYSFICIAGKSK